VADAAALILAGSRPGERDAVAAYAGAPHKALIELGGLTLLERVALAIREAGIGRILVSADDPAVVTEAWRLGLDVVAPAAGPSASVAAAFERAGAPMLVTTADHALLRGEWVQQFLADTPDDADVAVLLARRDRVEAAAPGTRRTWLRFGDGDWSGCNLFLLRTPEASGAIDLWRSVEADRKRPWRIVRRLGAGTLLRYLAGRLSLVEGVARLGRVAGVRAAAVTAMEGLAAVDVDKPADLDLVRRLVDGS
jgi:GTP:adenosylcobinamide-phosphate guanylyltransferase